MRAGQASTTEANSVSTSAVVAGSLALGALRLGLFGCLAALLFTLGRVGMKVAGYLD